MGFFLSAGLLVGFLLGVATIGFDPRFAVPLRETTTTVNSVLVFNVSKEEGTCTLLSVDDESDDRSYDKGDSFQLSDVSECVTLKCKKKSVEVVLKKSSCQYGDDCEKDLTIAQEGRMYECLVFLEKLDEDKVKEGGDTVVRVITYRLWNFFVATPPVSFTSTFSKNPNTCTMGGVTVFQGQDMVVPGLDSCAVVRCTKKGLKYLPGKSECSVEGKDGCFTEYVRGCTNYTCARAVLTSKNKKGTASALVLNSWVSLDEPSCEYEGDCLSAGEVAGSTEEPPCSELVCLEGSPGLLEVLPSSTGCLVELLGDMCVDIGKTSEVLVPVGPLDNLSNTTCIESRCKQISSGPIRPVFTYLDFFDFGCRDEALDKKLPEVDKPFGCFRKGVITEKNCTRLRCDVVLFEGVITATDLMGRCLDENDDCRSPGEPYISNDGTENCTCPFGGGEPDCETIFLP